MSPLWRQRLFALGGGLLAIALGWWLANGNYGLPMLVCILAAVICFVAVFEIQLDAAVMGALVVGYIVGNRGFAQLFLLPGVPIFPAEAGLAFCLAWLAVRSAREKTLPIRRDALNLAIVFWVGVGAARIIPDARIYGIMAIRDFATVYYAAFFFIAQALSHEPKGGLFLRRCLLYSALLVIPLVELFRRFPDFFIERLVVGGIPLIFFKGDLAATFMAVGVVLAHRHWEQSGRLLWLLVALSGLLGVLITGNRASLVGLLVPAVWLALGRRTRLLRTLLVTAVAGSIGVFSAREIGLVSARDNFGLSIYERVLSITDFSGNREYLSEDVELKGDNNQFRLVWWKSILVETWEGNPWLGLGFGHDLAAGFVRRYYPDSDEEFTARSPHSIWVTVMGRTGLIGALTFLGIVLVMIRDTWRALKSTVEDEERVTAWTVPWVVLTSATFGVVLEGPMGAVVFWTSLGMAAATASPAVATAPSHSSPAVAASTRPATA